MKSIKGEFIKQSIVILVLVILPTTTILPYIQEKNNEFWIVTVFSSVLILGLFYLNYLWLLPKFYYKNQRVKYFILLLLSMVTVIISMRLILVGLGPDDQFIRLEVNSRKFGSFVILRIILTLILSWFFVVYEKFEKEKTERKNIELKLLKSQYNPHFLFNALNSIYSKTIDVSDEASTLILKLSSILRYNLNHNSADHIPLSEEVNNINNYLDLQIIRLAENVQVTKQIIVPDSKHSIAPFLLTPLLENAFKYGVNNTDLCKIEIYLSLDSNQLIFSVLNKKATIDHSIPLSEGFGLGISSVKKLLELHYPNNYQFLIEEQHERYTVSLKIHLI